jgi:glycosyltransferase involved in cell wall biosynthesis
MVQILDAAVARVARRSSLSRLGGGRGRTSRGGLSLHGAAHWSKACPRERARVCLDLTPSEMYDRHGGFTRYGVQLLRHLLELPSEERAGIELLALPSSSRPPVPAESLDLERLLTTPLIPEWRHGLQRRFLVGPLLQRAGVRLFHSLHPGVLPVLSHPPLLATVHDLVPVVVPRPLRGAWGRVVRIGSWLEQAIRLRRPVHLIAISKTTMDDACWHIRIRPERITTVRHGVDPVFFHPLADADARARERASVGSRYGLGARWFLAVGSDHYRKNQELLFDAWRLAAGSGGLPEDLVVVGHTLYADGLQRLRATAEKAGLGGRFHWLADLDDSALPALYRGATALVAPSLYEGFGMTLLEAMACGTPVLASRAGAHVEVGGEAALYFDPRSVRDLAGLLRVVSSSAVLGQELCEKGLARATEFTWEETARETLAVYRRVLASLRPGYRSLF